MIQQVLEALSACCDAALAGDYEVLRMAPFADFTLHVSPNGSAVVALEPAAPTRAALPLSHRIIDLFLLEPHAQLGRHYHRRASAHIHILRGLAVIETDGALAHAGPGHEAFFHAGKVHNVIAKDEAVVFASFQDHPIIQNDGALDYFAIVS